MVSILQSGKGGGLISETKLPMQKLELKMQGGLMREGGRNRGILRYFHAEFLKEIRYIGVYLVL